MVKRLRRLLEARSRSDVVRLSVLYTIISVLVSVGGTYFFAKLYHWKVEEAVLPAAILPLLLAPWMTWTVTSTAYELHHTRRELERLVRTDPLTGILNRRGLQEVMESAYAERGERRLCAIVVDIDHFKAINDIYGHAGGDAVIIRIADILRRTLKPLGAAVGRLGGDELGALVFDVTLAEASAVAEIFRCAIEGATVQHDGRRIRVTTSIGVSELLPEDDSVDAMLIRADFSLYAAKAEGRNVVRVHFGKRAA